MSDATSRAASGEHDRILVCRTCPRYEPPPPPGEAGRGSRLSVDIKQLVAALSEQDRLTVRVVNCLAGCKNPCNVALDGPGKYRLRFSRLEVADAGLMIEVAMAYANQADGNLADDQLPESLRRRLTARSPVRIGR